MRTAWMERAAMGGAAGVLAGSAARLLCSGTTSGPWPWFEPWQIAIELASAALLVEPRTRTAAQALASPVLAAQGFSALLLGEWMDAALSLIALWLLLIVGASARAGPAAVLVRERDSSTSTFSSEPRAR